MKKYPKYIIMPSAIALYFVVMALFSIRQNDGKLPPQFFLIVIVEAVVVVALFLALRYLHRKRGQ